MVLPNLESAVHLKSNNTIFCSCCRWKECSHKNQLRYSESIKILKEMKELYDC